MPERLLEPTYKLSQTDWENVNLLTKQAEFEGFTPEQETWTRNAIEAIGLPTENVSRVAYEENGAENGNWLGSVRYSDGKLTLYYSLAEFADHPEVEPLSTITHEMGHETCPFNKNNDKLYGSREARERVKMHTYDIAQQTDITGIALNSYHSELLEQFRTGDISIGRFLRETHAIMVELRLNEPDKLQAVEKAQEQRLIELQEEGDHRAKGIDFTHILSEEGEDHPTGIDSTLITLIEDVKTVDELEAHAQYMADFRDQNTHPFRKSESETVDPVRSFYPTAFFSSN